MEISLNEKTEKPLHGYCQVDQSKKLTDTIPPEKLNAIFHHPECRAMFEKVVAEVRIDKDANAELIDYAFGLCILNISFAQLDLTKEEFALLATNPLWGIHSGISMRVIRHLRNISFKEYAKDGSEGRAILIWANEVIQATFAIEEQLQEKVGPIKMQVIEQFWAGANFKQQNEVNAVLSNQKKQSGMQGMSNGIPKLHI